MKWTESKIQQKLYSALSSHKYRFLNIYLFNEESDWLSFLQSGYCWEIEVKISRSDFKADAKKSKHSIMKSLLCGKKAAITKWGVSRVLRKKEEVVNPELAKKEHVSRSGVEYYHEQVWSNISIQQNLDKKVANRFYYAVPAGLIKLEEVPDHAGLIYIGDKIKFVKKAPLIHGNKIVVKRAFNKMYNNYEEMLVNKFSRI